MNEDSVLSKIELMKLWSEGVGVRKQRLPSVFPGLACGCRTACDSSGRTLKDIRFHGQEQDVVLGHDLNVVRDVRRPLGAVPTQHHGVQLHFQFHLQTGCHLWDTAQLGVRHP